MKPEFVKLDSVGTTLSAKTGVAYPTLLSGGYDESCGTHLEDCCDEWYSSLSEMDTVTVNRVKEGLA